MLGAAQDVITNANFGEDRLRGFGVARGRILAFSIDLLRRLYNTLAPPRECVMRVQTICMQSLFEEYSSLDYVEHACSVHHADELM